MNKKIASELAVGIILILAIIVGGIFYWQSKKVVSDVVSGKCTYARVSGACKISSILNNTIKFSFLPSNNIENNDFFSASLNKELIYPIEELTSEKSLLKYPKTLPIDSISCEGSFRTSGMCSPAIFNFTNAIVLYFKSETQENDILKFKNELEKLDGVVFVKYISKGDALEDVRAKHNNDQEMINALETLKSGNENPLLSSLKIEIRDSAVNADIINNYVDKSSLSSYIQTKNYNTIDFQ